MEVFWKLALEYKVNFLIDRVSTDANPADWPSRDRLEIGRAAGWETVLSSWPAKLRSKFLAGPGKLLVFRMEGISFETFCACPVSREGFARRLLERVGRRRLRSWGGRSSGGLLISFSMLFVFTTWRTAHPHARAEKTVRSSALHFCVLFSEPASVHASTVSPVSPKH